MEREGITSVSRLRELDFEPANLRKPFYAYIKNLAISRQNPTQITISRLKNGLQEMVETTNDNEDQDR